MSHDATNWAIKQRGIKPAMKIVLWNLCDRYHPDNGCFPSQETLAADCEIPRSTLNVYLADLERRGLICRERRRENGSKQQERTRYYFPFEDGFEKRRAENPCPEAGHGPEGEKPCPETAKSRVQNLDSNPVREPVREARAGLREAASTMAAAARSIVSEAASAMTDAAPQEAGADKEEDPRRLAKRVKVLEIGRHQNPWPGAADVTTGWALKEFTKLSPEERRLAEERRDAYLASCPKDGKGRPKAVRLGVYLRDRKFLDVAPAKPEPAIVAPFGPIWASLRALAFADGPVAVEMPAGRREAVQTTFATLNRTSQGRAAAYLASKGVWIGDDGSLCFPDNFEEIERRRMVRDVGYPDANRLHELASRRDRTTAPAHYAALADLCEPVPVGSALFEEWREHDQEANRPFIPNPGNMPVVWFPKGGPSCLAEFERAARAALVTDRGGEHAA